MGSTESLSIASFFALFGVNEFSLSIGLLPWFVLFALALYALTARCASRWTALDRDYAVVAHVMGAPQRFPGRLRSRRSGSSDAHLGARRGRQADQARERTSGVVAGGYTVQIGVWSPSDHRHLRLGLWWHPSRAGELLRLTVSADDSVTRPSP